MQSRGISRKSNMSHFQISVWLKSSLENIHFAENPTWIGPVVPKLYQIKDSQNNRKHKRIAFLFLSVSHNQCSCLPTDPLNRNTYGIRYHKYGRLLKCIQNTLWSHCRSSNRLITLFIKWTTLYIMTMVEYMGSNLSNLESFTQCL